MQPILSCFNNVCTAQNQAEDAGVDVATAQPVVQSQAGESCTARIDCVLGLLCVNNVCLSPTAQTDAAVQKGAGERGESCQSRADCAAGLACINSVCAKADFGIAQSAKTCVAIDCMTAVDCCPKINVSNCAFYQTQCGDGAVDTYCKLYNDNCKCKEDQYVCTADNKCLTKYSCGSDGGTTCPSGYVCNAGTECVRCLKDTDCGSGQACTPEHACVTSCQKHADCNYLQDCKMGICVETGCTTDRECVAKNVNPLSKCAMGKCQTPCQTDTECNVGRYSYQACVMGSCQDIGCETNEECRIRLSGVSLNRRRRLPSSDHSLIRSW